MRKKLQKNDKRRALGLTKKQIAPILKLIYPRTWKSRTHPDVLKRLRLWEGKNA